MTRAVWYACGVDLSPTLQSTTTERDAVRCIIIKAHVQYPLVRIDDDDEFLKARTRIRGRRASLLVMDAGSWHRWQPASTAPTPKKGWFWQKKRVVPEPNDLCRVEVPGGEGDSPLCRSTNVSEDSYGLVTLRPAFRRVMLTVQYKNAMKV